MADTARKVEYFSVQVADQPGEAFRVLQALVAAGINLLACTARLAGGRAQIDVVPDDTARFHAAMSGAGLGFVARKSGFLIQGEDRPGALAQNLHLLAKAGINVTGIEAMAAGLPVVAGVLPFESVAEDEDCGVARSGLARGPERSHVGDPSAARERGRAFCPEHRPTGR